MNMTSACHDNMHRMCENEKCSCGCHNRWFLKVEVGNDDGPSDLIFGPFVTANAALEFEQRLTNFNWAYSYILTDVPPGTFKVDCEAVMNAQRGLNATKVREK